MGISAKYSTSLITDLPVAWTSHFRFEAPSWPSCEEATLKAVPHSLQQPPAENPPFGPATLNASVRSNPATPGPTAHPPPQPRPTGLVDP